MERVERLAPISPEIPALLPIRGNNGESPIVLHGGVTVAAAFAAMALKTLILEEEFFAFINRFLGNPEMVRTVCVPGIVAEVHNSNLFVFGIIETSILNQGFNELDHGNNIIIVQ